MAIKIITKGVIPKDIPWRGTCYNCKTVVECDKSDATYHSNYDCRDPRESSYYTTTCPVCKANIHVKEHQIAYDELMRG